jgi:hypothetical protein
MRSKELFKFFLVEQKIILFWSEIRELEKPPSLKDLHSSSSKEKFLIV